MKIGVYTPAFPGKHDTSHYAFVKQLVDAIAADGHECHVVVPYNILHYKKWSPTYEKYEKGMGFVEVYRPYFLSFSNIYFLQRITQWSRKHAMKRAERLLPKLDAVYAHFWWSGYECFHYAQSQHLPLIVASGESEVSKFKIPDDVNAFRDYVRGVVCVSSKNRDESVELGLTSVDKCGIFPNAVNTELFHKQDKFECRNRLGIKQDDFVVIFVGWFSERKGPLRVAEAINKVGNVKSIFVGKGVQNPECDGIIFKGSLPHEEVPLYLGAADCFVLPTLAEGCCNAVVEAMACGLPVISSNLPFNWDVLDETNSIMVEPSNVDEIAAAIHTLRVDSQLREKLTTGALKKAESLTINKRAQAIIEFIKKKVRE